MLIIERYKVDPMLAVCVQADINDKMRAILIDWLVEVHLKFKVSGTLEPPFIINTSIRVHLCDASRQPGSNDQIDLSLQLMPETLFLTVNLIDRFLTEKQVTRKNLQLVRGCL